MVLLLISGLKTAIGSLVFLTSSLLQTTPDELGELPKMAAFQRCSNLWILLALPPDHNTPYVMLAKHPQCPSLLPPSFLPFLITSLLSLSSPNTLPISLPLLLLFLCPPLSLPPLPSIAPLPLVLHPNPPSLPCMVSPLLARPSSPSPPVPPPLPHLPSLFLLPSSLPPHPLSSLLSPNLSPPSSLLPSSLSVSISPGAVSKAVMSFTPDSASDPSGLRPSHLKGDIHCPPSLEDNLTLRLSLFTTLLCSGCLPSAH